MQAIYHGARDAARNTPEDRDRLVDAIRVVAMVVVVLGHWLMAVIWVDPTGSVSVVNALDDHPGLQLLTWVFQVMPLFFLAGGYSNGRSLERSEDALDWLAGRGRRLVGPIVALVAFWAVATPLVRVVADDGLVRAATLGALVPLWFIAVYVGIVALAPLSHRAWKRWGWLGVAVGAAAAVAADVVRFTFEVEWIGWVNFLLVWGTVHQAGYGMADWRSPRVGRWLAPAGLVALVGLVWLGPYPLSMIGLDTQAVTNTTPPTIALLALAALQAGLVGLLSPTADRVLARPRVWAGVLLGGAMAMTWFAWHLTVMVLVAGADLALGGLVLGLEPFTTAWWLSRPLWLVGLAVLTAPVALGLARIEGAKRGGVNHGSWWTVVGLLGVVASVAALVLGGVTIWSVAGFFGAAWLAGAVGDRQVP